MDNPIKDKAIKSKDDIKEIVKKKKRKFFIPSKGVTIEANSAEEAAEKV